jgi:hypothetical protein
LQSGASPTVLARSVACGVAFGTFPVPLLPPLLGAAFAKGMALNVPLAATVQLCVGAGALRCVSMCVLGGKRSVLACVCAGLVGGVARCARERAS